MWAVHSPQSVCLVCEDKINRPPVASRGEAGGAGVTGVLLEPCHLEFPVSSITRWLLSFKNTSGAFVSFFFFVL